MSFMTNEPSAETQSGPALAATADQERSFLRGILSPLRFRDFRLLFTGQVTSSLGDQFYAVVLPAIVLRDGGTPRDLGLVLACYGLPRIGSLLLGGWLSDRFRPRRVMLLADVMRALVGTMLVTLVFLDQLLFWQLCVISAFNGAFAGLFVPASFSIMPEVLPEDTLQQGNALQSTSVEVSGLAGPGIAGIVVANVSPALALLIDQLSFVVSAIMLALMRTRKTVVAAVTGAAPEPEAADVTAEPEEAPPQVSFWELFRTSQLFQAVLIMMLLANVMFGGMLEVGVPSLAYEVFNIGSAGYGLLLSSYSAGAILGGLSVGWIGTRWPRGRLAMTLGMISAVMASLIPFLGGPIGSGVGMFGVGLTNTITLVLVITIVQQQLPEHLLGRAMGAVTFAGLGLFPLSVTLVGFIATYIEPVIIFPLTGLTLLIAFGFGLSQRALRTVR